MYIRTIATSLSLMLLPSNQMTAPAVILVLIITGLSWLAASQRALIVPRLLNHPLLVVLDIAISFAVLKIGGTSGPFFLSTVTTAALAGLLYRWPGMLAVSGLQILCYYLALGLGPEPGGVGERTFQELAGQPAYYPLVGFAGIALRRLFDEHAAQEAARRHAEVAAAAAEERARLAREMHDSLAKTLRGIALGAAALPAWVHHDPARAERAARHLAAATETASREAHCLVSELRAPVVARPLPDVVREAVEAWGDEHGITVRTVADADADVPLRVRYEAMAILAEALTNVARHAAATEVRVRLTAEGGDVVLTVEDDGCGFLGSPRGGHYGLIGLAERAERAGGSVSVASRPGAGTTIAARLPAGAVRTARAPAEVD